MNVGILTHPLETNYGGILQNYALQQALILSGHNPVTIDCHPRVTLQLLKYNLKSALLFPFPDKRRKFKWNSHIHPLFKSFAANIAMTDYCTSVRSEIITKHNLDAIIVGSDQVWRPKYVNNLYDMFLDFAQKTAIKKMAYAASFGTDQWEFSPSQTKRCRKLISRFDAVSVRENSGVNLCQKYFGINAVKVLDPTLLLDQNHYNRLIAHCQNRHKPYLLAYILDSTDDKLNLINTIARERNLETKIISAHDNVTITVEEWLTMFRDADYIVTDSFHGTVFSIIYHKDFISFANESRGGDRFDSLLCTLGLQKRIFGKGIENNPKMHINWNDIESQLTIERHNAMHFLAKISQ